MYHNSFTNENLPHALNQTCIIDSKNIVPASSVLFFGVLEKTFE
jgi:hypothetical protein